MNDIMDNIISSGILITTTITAYVAYRVWEQSRNERKSAALKAFLEYQAHVNNVNNRNEEVLVILNTGHVGAINVEILINDKPIFDWSEFRCEKCDKIVIGPGGRYQIPFHEYSESKIHPPFHVRILWSDESKKKRHWEGAVS